MTTPARRWPKNAEAARVDCIVEARRGLRAILPLLDESCRREDLYRRLAIAALAFREIEAKLHDCKTANLLSPDR